MILNKIFFKKQLFSYKKTLKNSSYRRHLSSIEESQRLKIFHKLVIKNQLLQFFFFDKFFELKETREVVNCLFKDMMHLVMM